MSVTTPTGRENRSVASHMERCQYEPVWDELLCEGLSVL